MKVSNEEKLELSNLAGFIVVDARKIYGALYGLTESQVLEQLARYRKADHGGMSSREIVALGHLHAAESHLALLRNTLGL